MYKKIIPAFISVLFLVSCTTQETSKNEKETVNKNKLNRGIGMCTQDAKMCPDGSYVSRNSKNNCKFDPCPQIK